MSDQFSHLFNPIEMRSVTIPNRLVFGPHGTRLVDPHNGHSTEEQARYYAERAKGGTGLIIAGSCMVHPNGMAAITNNIFDDSAIPGLKRITEMIHQYPTKVFVQLSHLGRQGMGYEYERPLWAASPIPCPLMREVPHEINGSEIEEIVTAYTEAAVRALTAGFDGMEIYMAHGYLLGGFLSPFSNKRIDEYGGSLENRMRLPLRIVDSVRSAVGEDVPVGIRISADEFVEGGITPEMSQEIARRMEDTGKIDFINVSQCTYATVYAMIPEMGFPPNPFIYLTSGIREAVEKTPVMAVAKINDPVQSEKILAEGHADMVVMVRGLIAEPELANKAREGRLDEIRTCISCNQGCIGRTEKAVRMGCIQNPAVGFEKERGIGTLIPAPVKKKVIVIGGGPAGLKVAEQAAERGHQVTLFEKSDQLGGQAMIAAKAPTRDDLANCVRFLETQVERLGVEINRGVEVTAELVAALNPDAVVVATGSTPIIPEIPGAGQDHVFDPWQILNEAADTGENVLVVDGGDNDIKFCSVAEFLAERGKKVQMITHQPSVGIFIETWSKFPILQRLRSKGIVFTGDTLIKSIENDSVTVADVFTGEERTIEDVDSVVFAWYNKAENALYNALQGKVKELYSTGDCTAPRRIIDAIREGFVTGRQI